MVQTVPGCSACISDCNSELCSQASPTECTDECRIVTCNEFAVSEDCESVCTDGCVLPLDCEEALKCGDGLLTCCNGYTQSLALASRQWEAQKFNNLQYYSNTSDQLQTPYYTSTTSVSETSLYSSGYVSSDPATAIEQLEKCQLRTSGSSHASFQSAIQIPHRCLWNGCSCTFTSAEELVSHVNSSHLWWAVQPVESTDSSLEDVACLWDHCSVYPDITSIPGSSSDGSSYQPLFNLLTQHLIHDHIGFVSDSKPDNDLFFHMSIPNKESSTLDPLLQTDQNEVTCTLSHLCHWKGCHKAFQGCRELHEHLVSEHVGTGKTQYECHWGVCLRHSERSFTSKQKILRHLQSHTGHRPFQCDLCGQHFSEAATLQQHMRRHTSEKPFMCDYPECGKSFTVKGALTIHQRTHNGEKPFKCRFCDRAFTESSNLSKHLRTHTGLKPYQCPETDCGRRFARVDQLHRHAKVHKKRDNNSK